MLDFDEMARRGLARETRQGQGGTTVPHAWVVEPIYSPLISIGHGPDSTMLLSSAEASGLGGVVAGMASRLDVAEAELEQAQRAAQEGQERVDRLESSIYRIKLGAIAAALWGSSIVVGIIF